MFSFLLENNLVSPNHSGLKPGNYGINEHYPLHLKSFNYLIKDLKLEASSWIFLKLLIKYVAKD